MVHDPATGTALPDSTIQRVLFTHHPVHIYRIPPITSTTGFSATPWTAPTAPTAQRIFTARIRILETSIASGHIKSDVVLEDPSSGELFAAAPYSSAAVVQQANDSTRFFAVRVVGEGRMKATVGMGFEERSAAFDFSVALGEVRKVLRMEGQAGGVGNAQRTTTTTMKKMMMDGEATRDFRLKEGEKIVVKVPGAVGRRRKPSDTGASESATAGDEAAALFSITPPPAAGVRPNSLHIQHQAVPSMPSTDTVDGNTAHELGFDDGEFGEFQ